MSKKNNKEEIENSIEDINGGLSKKELYELKKKEKEKERKKKNKKNKVNKRVNKVKKTSHQTSLVGRIFATVMLVLMVGSLVATISYYFRY